MRGGWGNNICASLNGSNGIFSGAFNTITEDVTHSSIDGGRWNLVEEHCSFIGGGYCNTVSSPFSAILGGSYNIIPAGFNHAAVFGNNVTAVASNTFHVECLNAVNTGVCVPGMPPGTIMWKAGNTIGASDCVLVIV